MIKAIETTYKGYRFRSRLEARWAVFFDHLGVKWEYEKEGFDLGDGMLYLPDFWLKTVNMWAEVKPEAFTPDEEERCKRLVQATGFDCLMLDGLSEYRPYWGWVAFSDRAMKTDYVLDAAYLDEKRFYCSSGFDGPLTQEAYVAYWEIAPQDIPYAYTAARQARFEHGEKGGA